MIKLSSNYRAKHVATNKGIRLVNKLLTVTADMVPKKTSTKTALHFTQLYQQSMECDLIKEQRRPLHPRPSSPPQSRDFSHYSSKTQANSHPCLP